MAEFWIEVVDIENQFVANIYELIARNTVGASAWAYGLRFSTSRHYNNPRRSSCRRGAKVWGTHGASGRTKIHCDLRAVVVWLSGVILTYKI